MIETRGGVMDERPVRTGARASIGIAAVVLGVLLFLAPLSVRGIAVVTGIGLALLGLAAALTPHRGDRAKLLGRVLGGALAVLGAAIALWPTAGAPWLASLIGAGLIAHGALALIDALRGGRDRRVAGALAGAAGIVAGVVTFSWPVLTLSAFRLGVGAWLVFIGLQLLLRIFVPRYRARRRSAEAVEAPGAQAGVVPAPRFPRLRRWSRTMAAGLALIVAVLAAYGSGTLLGGAPLPAPGAFYAPPTAPPGEPGQLLRSEPLTAGVPRGAEAWRILYTTTHPDGSAAVSSGTVIAPKQRGDGPLPLLSIAHGTTGIVPKCAPSLSATPFSDGAGTALVEMVTDHGWAAVTSDYIGLGTAGPHPYLIGDAEARNVLDATRAAQHLQGLSLASDTVVWGHSQGGQGSLWTGQIAHDYAPEITVKGVAAFAPAADLFGLAEADKTEAAGKTVSAYLAASWSRIYPDLDLEQHLTPGSAGKVERIADLCFNGDDVLAAILRGSQVPNQIFPDSLLDGAFGERLKKQTPEGPFPAPVLVAQGLADPLVKPAMQHDWVEARCEAGEEIDYRTYPGLGHLSLVAADSPLTPQLVQWTLDRWEGAPATPNCGDLPE